MILPFLFHLFFVAPARAADLTDVPVQKSIYLTFDLDMTPAMERKLKKRIVKSYYDPSLIDLLNQEHVPATFFVTGMFAELYPHFVKTLAANRQFRIGNHTYDHAAFEAPCYGLSVVRTQKEKREEIQKTQDVLVKLIGETPTLFRYPGLCHTLRDDKLVQMLGLRIDDGDIISGDAFQKRARPIIVSVMKQAHNDGVVIMHPGGANAPATVEALRTLIPALRKQGYEFLSR